MPVDGIGLRGDLAHVADHADVRVIAERDRDARVLGRLAHEQRRHVEHRVLAALLCDLHHHLAGLHDFTGLGALAGDDAGDIRAQLGIADVVARGARGGLGRRNPRLRRRQLLLRIIVLGARDDAGGHQRAVACLVVARLHQRCLAGGKVRLRRAQRVLRILRLDARHDLPGGNPVADGHAPLDQATADPEGEIGLGLGLDLAA